MSSRIHSQLCYLRCITLRCQRSSCCFLGATFWLSGSEHFENPSILSWQLCWCCRVCSPHKDPGKEGMNFGEILLKLLERTSDLHLFLEGGLDLDMSCHWGLLKNEWLQHTHHYWKWWFPSGFRSTTCSDKPMWAVEPKSSAILSTGWLTGSPPYWMMMIPYIPGSMIPYVLWTNHGLFSCKRGWYPPSTGFIYPW